MGRSSDQSQGSAGRRVGQALLAAAAGAGLWACSAVFDFKECETAEDCLGGAACDTGVCQVTVARGAIQRDTRWTADQVHVLDGIVFVTDGATLTVEPGAQVLGQRGSALIVTAGATLDAVGTADAPVVFTSAQPAGTRAPGDWGGVALLGRARVNRSAPHLEGLAASDQTAFGGDDDAGSCGRLRYARIEFAGQERARDDELNGLTLAGCGAGTIVEQVQVHRASDDGVQIVGGTVGLRQIVISRAGDDGMDWEAGWRGQAQFVVVQQDRTGDHAVEGDNDPADPEAQPRSRPTVSNLTVIGSRDAPAGVGLFLSGGTAGEILNAVVVGPAVGIDVENGALPPGPPEAPRSTVRQLIGGDLDPASEGLRLQAVQLFDVGPDGQTGFPQEPRPAGADDPAWTQTDDDGFDEARHFLSEGGGVTVGEDPELARPYSLSAPDLRPLRRLVGATLPAGRGLDEAARYRGAFDAQAASGSDWTAGWTAYPAD